MDKPLKDQSSSGLGRIPKNPMSGVDMSPANTKRTIKVISLAG